MLQEIKNKNSTINSPTFLCMSLIFRAFTTHENYVHISFRITFKVRVYVFGDKKRNADRTPAEINSLHFHPARMPFNFQRSISITNEPHDIPPSPRPHNYKFNPPRTFPGPVFERKSTREFTITSANRMVVRPSKLETARHGAALIKLLPAEIPRRAR